MRRQNTPQVRQSCCELRGFGLQLAIYHEIRLAAKGFPTPNPEWAGRIRGISSLRDHGNIQLRQTRRYDRIAPRNDQEQFRTFEIIMIGEPDETEQITH
jgi:hypothetical protein